MKHLMIDIETLDNRPTAAVVAIGARIFDATGIGAGFEVYIDPAAAKKHGTMGEETMQWWAKQDYHVMTQVMSGRVDSSTGLKNLYDFIAKHGPRYVWAYPPQFDILILQHLARQTGLIWPFHYRDERCARTIKFWGEQIGLKFGDCYEHMNKHMPLDDATAQARVIQRVLERAEGMMAKPVAAKPAAAKARPAKATDPRKQEADLASTLAALEGQDP